MTNVSLIIKRAGVKRFILYFGLFFLAFLIWQVGFYPATMSPDSLNEWQQINLMKFNAAHPFLHVILIMGLRKLWDNPAVVPLFQNIINSILFAYLFSVFDKKNKNKYILVPLIFLLMTSPVIGIYTMVIWKDVTFAQLILLLATLFVTGYLEIKSRSSLRIFIFALITAFVSLIRGNGAIYIFITPIILWFFSKVPGKKILYTFFVSIVLYFGFNLIFSRLVTFSSDHIGENFKLQLVASALKGGRTIKESEKLVLEALIPVDVLQNKYQCDCVNYIFETVDFEKYNRLLDNKDFSRKFNSTVDGIIYRNIPNVVSDRSCLFSFLIGLGESQYFYHWDVSPNSINIPVVYKNDTNTILMNYLEWSKSGVKRTFFWSHWFYFLIYLFYFIRGLVKQNRLLLGYISIVIVNVGVLFLVGLSHDFRYLFMLPYCIWFLPLIDGIISKPKQY